MPGASRGITDASTLPPVESFADGLPDSTATQNDESAVGVAASSEHSVTGYVGLHKSPHLPSTSTTGREAHMARCCSASQPGDYDVPDALSNLDELIVSPIENLHDGRVYRHRGIGQARDGERGYPLEEQLQRRLPSASDPPAHPPPMTLGDAEKAGDIGNQAESHVSRHATQLYTLSYLVFFAILGTLARLGLEALTSYPGSPVSFSSIWPNFGGSFVMGFLAEDRMLFRENGNLARGVQERHEESGFDPSASGAIAPDGAPEFDLAAAKRAHLAIKKTIPLYVGLATGFCGSFTSFSAFIRDIFLALSNDTASPNPPRNGGYSFLAVLAVITMTVSLSLAGLFVGAHLAIALDHITPSIPSSLMRKFLDRLVVLLGWGCWLGAVLLSILPPDRGASSQETWRGRATFALVLAPLGCLIRFYTSLCLNGRIASFPLGTFAVNIFGTLVLGMSWDLAHVPLGGVVGCQLLQGVQDGFCGCLTTVSTWVAELSGLRRRHAYLYGTTSVLVALAILVATMGGLRWSLGFSALRCST